MVSEDEHMHPLLQGLEAQRVDPGKSPAPLGRWEVARNRMLAALRSKALDLA